MRSGTAASVWSTTLCMACIWSSSCGGFICGMDGLHRGGDESEAEPLAALADILEEKKEVWQRGNGQ